jgi:hypothetical protein
VNIGLFIRKVVRREKKIATIDRTWIQDIIYKTSQEFLKKNLGKRLSAIGIFVSKLTDSYHCSDGSHNMVQQVTAGKFQLGFL